MKRRRWYTNRVFWGMAVFFTVVALWEFLWKPQYRPFYEQGVAEYQKYDYPAALHSFESAYSISPNAVDVILMMGWTNLKLRRYEEARFYFQRVLKIDPRVDEALLGDSFVTLETGHGSFDMKLINRMVGRRGTDPDVRMLLAGALAQQGKYFEAAQIYQSLLQSTVYSKEADDGLQTIFGYRGFDDPLPQQLPPLQRPQELQVQFRAAEGFMQKQTAAGWQKYYVAGVDLGPAWPGYYPSDPPKDGLTYLKWLNYSSSVNANVIRAYTLLPTSFYRAYHHYLAAGGKMVLYQQIWIGDPPNNDLYDPNFVEQSKAEIRYVIDAIHGHGVVPPKVARGAGIYDQDVSSNVGALLLGRELEPSVAVQTNVTNPGKTRYQGQYVSIANGNPTETWFAMMLDYLVAYETGAYNWQHPVAVVNWPPLDPLSHPTESSISEDLRLRISKGEAVLGLDDNDVTSIDEAKFQASQGFPAGLFASYHVYPYYPDFLILDPGYLKTRDRQGPNPYYAYLRELKNHIPYPLVITEFGVPDSLGISHFHPLGWNHGGLTEDQQAQILDRLANSIREAGCAGGVVFSLIDEWYKHNWLTVDFENPLDRAALWLNVMDPEKRFGLVGFHTSKWKLYAGEDAGWAQERQLYQEATPSARTGDAMDAARTIRSVQAATDEAYLYLRINVGCVECGMKGRTGIAFDKVAYALAINTAPGMAGIRQLPFGPSVTPGANFLLLLGDPKSSKLLISDNYYPYSAPIRGGAPSKATEQTYRKSFHPTLATQGTFQDFDVVTNRVRYGRDGTMFPGYRYSRSLLRYGNGDPTAPDYDSLSEWYADAKRNAIFVRISWGKLLVTDPSSRRVFFGVDENLQVQKSFTSGVDVSVFTLIPNAPGGAPNRYTVAASLPALNNGVADHPEQLVWKGWEKVEADPYYKKAYYRIQKDFADFTKAPIPAAPPATGKPSRARRSTP